jgi:hypothetical protein
MLFVFIPIKVNAEDTPHDIPFTGEISYDYLDYAKMSNVVNLGDIAFDDEYIYYTEYDETAGFGYEKKDDVGNYQTRIYKKRLDGKGEPIVILDETDDLYYAAVRNIIISNGRVYFSAIPHEYGFLLETDNFFQWLFSMDTDGNDLRIELRDDMGTIYIVDEMAYYYREFLGDIEPGFIEYDIKAETFRDVCDEYGIYNLVTDDLVLLNYYSDNYYFYTDSPKEGIKIIDRKSGEVLFFMADTSADFLFGDYLISRSGELINIKTLETKDFVKLDEDSFISDMTVYKNKLYYLFMKRRPREYESTKMLISYDFKTGQSLIEKVFFRNEINETEYFENMLYSAPNGVYIYTPDGFVTCIIK